MSVIETPAQLDTSRFFGWTVTVLNDDFNTFEHVAATLARVIPNITVESGWQYAQSIHETGSADVYIGMKEPAQHYWAQLDEAGLTLSPLKQG